jgi:hypothetical protein
MKDDYDLILEKPSSQWTSRERLTVIAAVSQSNLWDKETNVGVVVIPYYPAVITAINRSMQATKGWDEDELQKSIALTVSDDTLSSLYQNHASLLNENGIYHKNILELDSLMFFMTLTNRSWPCAVPLIEVQGPTPTDRKMVPLYPQSDMPCPQYDLTKLAEHVYLMNDQNLKVHPTWIWGRRHENLTSQETLLLMFRLRAGEYHFFKKTSGSMRMVVEGFDREVYLDFPLARAR